MASTTLFEFNASYHPNFESVRGDFQSIEEAFCKQERLPGIFVRTQIVVLPKKSGMRKNPVSHILNYLEKDRPSTFFVDALETKRFEEMCAKADSCWRSANQIVHKEIVDLNFDPSIVTVEDIPKRFRGRIMVDEKGCWIWTGAIGSGGYGRIRRKGKNTGAHRVMFEALASSIPDGAILRHKCDVPRCVNPQHLLLGVYEDNTRDMIERGRAVWQVKKPKKKRKW